MRNRHMLSMMGLWILIVGCGFAFSERPVPSSQPVPARVQTTPRSPLEPSVDVGMHQLERLARVDMILYKGRVGEPQHASNPIRVDAVALTAATAGR